MTNSSEINWEINWNEQWANHAYGFKDGLAHICFNKLKLPSNEKIVLAPGPGFGDFSHPTTRLVLCMMCEQVANKTVLDVGCGSGILSLAAARFGATSVFGIDVEDDAIAHAAHNANINNLSSICHFDKKAKSSGQILLMNMIRSEQKVAYTSLPVASQTFELAFTSGILKEERANYLKQTSEWGWKCIKERQQNGWLGFCFTYQKDCEKTS